MSKNTGQTVIRYAPGSVASLKNNIYTSWNGPEGAYTAMDTLRTAGLGPFLMLFDSSSSETHPDIGSAAIVLPAGEWDMTNCAIGNELSDTGANITFDEDCYLSGTRWFFSQSLSIYGTASTSPFTNFTRISITGTNFNAKCLPGAAPLWTLSDVTLCSSSDLFGSIGWDSDDSPSTNGAPVIDLNGQALGFMGHCNFESDSIADLSEDGLGLVFSQTRSSRAHCGRFCTFDWQFPNLPETVLWIPSWVGERHRVFLKTELDFGDFETEELVMHTGTYSPTYNECATMDTTDVTTVVLPTAIKAIGEKVYVKDYTGNAATKNITIAVQTGEKLENVTNGTDVIDTDNGFALFTCTGFGNWIRIG